MYAVCLSIQFLFTSFCVADLMTAMDQVSIEADYNAIHGDTTLPYLLANPYF